MLSLASLHHIVVDADAVVNDTHLKVVVILDRHGDTGSLSVFADVGERFLNDCLLYTSPSPRDA